MLSHTGEKRCLKKLQYRKRRDFFNTRNRKKRELVLFPPEIASLILNFGGPFFFCVPRIFPHQHFLLSRAPLVPLSPAFYCSLFSFLFFFFDPRL